MSERQLSIFRQKYLGFIFQAYNLIASLTASENVELPLIFKEIVPKKRRKMVKEIMNAVGLKERAKHKPSQMSGGQQQRVSIGRALMNRPAILLADEPTGNLDSKSSRDIVELLKLSNKKYKQTIIMITHDYNLALNADRIITIDDGKIKSDEKVK